MQSNRKLQRLANQDQKERECFFEDPEKVTNRDVERRKQVRQLVAQGQVKTARDYFNAALIFQHGLTARDYKTALSFAKRSIKLGGGKWAKWLFAVITDRLLLSEGKKQKFGTQFSIVSGKRKGKTVRMMRLLPIEKRIGDTYRAQYGISPLKEILADDGKIISKKQKKISFKLN